MIGGRDGIGWAIALELAPAASFGGAVAFGTAAFLQVSLDTLVPAASGTAALLLAWAALHRFARHSPAFPIAEFEQAPIEPEEADLPVPAPAPAEEPELLLDEPLSESDHEPVARIVSLFAAQQPVPTPGELTERIERHLAAPGRPAPPDATPQDATRELHEALAALRRSLR